MKHLIETVAWLACVRPRSLASEATKHLKQCLAAPLAFVAAFLMFGTPAYAEETIIITEPMPENCQRRSDGTIRCDGLSLDSWCAMNASYGRGLRQFCYNNGYVPTPNPYADVPFGDGSGGSGGSGSGSGGNDSGGNVRPPSVPDRYLNSRSCSQYFGQRCHRTSSAGHFGPSGKQPNCRCGVSIHNPVTGWSACPSDATCAAVEETLSTACELAMIGAASTGAAIVCGASIPATGGIATAAVCGTAVGVAFYAVDRMYRICRE